MQSVAQSIVSTRDEDKKELVRLILSFVDENRTISSQSASFLLSQVILNSMVSRYDYNKKLETDEQPPTFIVQVLNLLKRIRVNSEGFEVLSNI
jgi:hypothetical protein